MVPRSTSAATAAEPRLIAQIENSRMMKGWVQNAIMIDADEGASPTPMFRIHWIRPPPSPGLEQPQDLGLVERGHINEQPPEPEQRRRG